MGKDKLDERETETETDSESGEAEFVSLIEEEDMDSLPSDEVYKVELRTKSSSDGRLACGRRIDTGNNVELAKELVEENDKLYTSETIREGKNQLLDSAHRNS